MNLSFEMTPEEYYLGWKYKNKKTGKRNINICIFCIIVSAITLALGILTKYFYAYFLGAMFLILPIFKIALEKKSVMDDFSSSPILNGKTTLFLRENGLQVINGFEKIFCPFDKLFAVKNEKSYLTILPTYKKGIFVINKDKYKGEELEEIIKKIKEKVNTREKKYDI